MGLRLRNWIDGEADPVFWDSIMFVSADMVNNTLELKFDGTREDSHDKQQLFINLSESSMCDLVEQTLDTLMENASDYVKWRIKQAISKHIERKQS